MKTRWACECRAWQRWCGGVQKGAAAMGRAATEHSHREVKRWERARCRRDDAGGAWRCRPALAAVCECAIFSAQTHGAEARRVAGYKRSSSSSEPGRPTCSVLARARANRRAPGLFLAAGQQQQLQQA